MSTLTEQSSAQPDTSGAAYQQWRKAVEAELQGAPFDKKLVTKTFENIALQPVYTRLETVPEASDAGQPGAAPFRRAYDAAGYARGAWEFAQQIATARASDFNGALLHDLGRGQNSVVLTLDRAARSGQDPDATNAAVGVDGVSIADLPDLATALQDVELACIPVHFDAGVSPLAAAALYTAYARKRGTSWGNLSGSLTADPLRELAELGALPTTLDAALDQLAGWTKWAVEKTPGLKTVGVSAEPILEAGGNGVQELAYALAAGTEYVRSLGNRGVAVETVLPRLRFSFAIGPQFFSEIAKFRAFRLLWARVAQAFAPNAAQVRPAVHARTARWNKTVLDIHVNMLRGTTEALSAVLGGIDSLHIGPFDEIVGIADEFSRRIARNVHTLLAEEFRLLSPTDPAGGSWYVEKLTDELARKAWALFQEIEKQGGCAAALRNGFVQKQVAAIAAEKADAVGKRRLGLVGTNLFPNLREKLVTARANADVTARKGEISSRRPKIERPTAVAWSDLFVAAQNAAEKGATIGQLSTWTVNSAGEKTAAALTPRRASEVFENLRRASEAIAAKGAGRPKVFVAKMGPLTQHKARADFTAGFFAVGGFEMIAKETFETAEAAAAAAAKSGAPVAVLCSTDETYPTFAPVFAQALKAAKPEVTLVLAGLPAPDVAATFKAAGFDEFIHIRANVAELLGKLLTKLGAKL